MLRKGRGEFNIKELYMDKPIEIVYKKPKKDKIPLDSSGKWLKNIDIMK